MARSWNLAFLVAALCLLAATARAGGADERVSIDRLRPTQTEIGRYRVARRLASWERAAAKAGQPLADFARDVIKPRQERDSIPALIDPDGDIRITDGHHRVAALLELRRRTGVDFALELDVVGNYRGTDFARYAQILTQESKIGYFAGLRGTPEEVVRALPRSFAELGDNPVRSIVGEVFDRAKLRGDRFSDYVQFEIADLLLDQGLLESLARRGLIQRSMPWDAAGRPEIVRATEESLFGNRRVVAALRQQVATTHGKAKVLLEAIDRRERKIDRRIDRDTATSAALVGRRGISTDAPLRLRRGSTLRSRRLAPP